MQQPDRSRVPRGRRRLPSLGSTFETSQGWACGREHSVQESKASSWCYWWIESTPPPSSLDFDNQLNRRMLGESCQSTSHGCGAPARKARPTPHMDQGIPLSRDASWAALTTRHSGSIPSFKEAEKHELEMTELCCSLQTCFNIIVSCSKDIVKRLAFVLISWCSLILSPLF